VVLLKKNVTKSKDNLIIDFLAAGLLFFWLKQQLITKSRESDEMPKQTISEKRKIVLKNKV
jgi:hypothetical protein